MELFIDRSKNIKRLTLIDVAGIAQYIRLINRDKTKSKEAAHNEVMAYLSERFASAESSEDRFFFVPPNR